MRQSVLILMTLCGTLAGCGGRQPPAAPVAADGNARAAALRAAAPGLTALHGRWDERGSNSEYTAYFSAGRLGYLDERQRLAASPSSLHNEYFFDDGTLFYFSGELPAAAGYGGGPDALATTVPGLAEFRGAQVLRAVRNEHFGEVPLTPEAIDAIRRHAAALAGAAANERAAQRPESQPRSDSR
jgi:hypothetical protein